MALHELLEKLVTSDVRLGLLSSGVKSLRFAVGQFGKSSNMVVCHIGPSEGSLGFSYGFGETLGGSPLREMINFGQSGSTLLQLQDEPIRYQIHNKPETLPSHLSYGEVLAGEYIEREKQLCDEIERLRDKRDTK